MFCTRFVHNARGEYSVWCDQRKVFVVLRTIFDEYKINVSSTKCDFENIISRLVLGSDPLGKIGRLLNAFNVDRQAYEQHKQVVHGLIHKMLTTDAKEMYVCTCALTCSETAEYHFYDSNI